MSESLYAQLLNLAVGALLLTAVLILWRRELAAIINVFALQGIALAVLVGLIALDEGSAELGAVAVGVLVLRAGILPWLLRRALAGAGATRRETQPLVNVVSSLLVAARNSWIRMLCWVQTRRSVRSAVSSARRCVGVATVATVATAPMTISMNALSASTASNPPTAVSGPPVATVTAVPIAVASTPAALRAPTHTVAGRQPAMPKTAAPTSGINTGQSIIRVVISRAAPAGRRCRWRRTLPGCGS